MAQQMVKSIQVVLKTGWGQYVCAHQNRYKAYIVEWTFDAVAYQQESGPSRAA